MDIKKNVREEAEEGTIQQAQIDRIVRKMPPKDNEYESKYSECPGCNKYWFSKS